LILLSQFLPESLLFNYGQVVARPVVLFLCWLFHVPGFWLYDAFKSTLCFKSVSCRLSSSRALAFLVYYFCGFFAILAFPPHLLAISLSAC